MRRGVGVPPCDGVARPERVQFNRVLRHFPLMTLALATLQFLTHRRGLSEPEEVRCVSAAAILENGQWGRLVTASFGHRNHVHLLVNLASFLWKGAIMETATGPGQLCSVLAKAVLLVGVCNAALVIALSPLASTAGAQCMSTSAGVLVVLKMLNQAHFPRTRLRFGTVDCPLPPPAVSWMEVVLLYLAGPDTALPVLSGLLVGVIFKNRILRWGSLVTIQN